jgi:hypothetical protein
VKVERFTSDSATLCYIGKRSRYQKVNFGLQNALNLAYEHLQFKIFSRGNTPDPLKGNGGEGRGRARKWKGGKDRGMGAGEEGTGREGTGGPPFTNPRYATDCTAYTGPRMRHGL